jgi:hypothetical protein
MAHIYSGPDRAQGVVLVELWDAEHGHDGIANELLNTSTVPRDSGLHFLKVAGHEAAEGLWIELLTKSC